MSGQLEHCNGTYRRGTDGVWRYPWGDPVPGATDLTLADLLAIHYGTDLAGARLPLRAVSRSELAWLTGQSEDLDQVFVRRRGTNPPDTGDLVVGMWAPELHVLTMLTVNEIAELAGVSKATIDSYRYRGYLPEPQTTRGRTPLWARPIVQRWLTTRPGCGWRSDIYGTQRAGRTGPARAGAAAEATAPAGSED